MTKPEQTELKKRRDIYLRAAEHFQKLNESYTAGMCFYFRHYKIIFFDEWPEQLPELCVIVDYKNRGRFNYWYDNHQERVFTLLFAAELCTDKLKNR
jgi:ubiquitin